MTSLSGSLPDTEPRNEQADNPTRPAPHENPILHPSRLHGRYYPRTLMREQFEFIADRYISGTDAGTLVDLGCGDTPYRSLFEPNVERYIAVDLPGNERADRCLTPDGAAPLDDGAAGVVLSTQVLEHVEDPAGYLRECRRLLRPGGLLVLSTHGVWKYHPHPVDYWRWTGEGLRRLIESEGFEVQYRRGLMGAACCGLMLLQDAIVTKLPRRLRTPTAFLMQRLVMAADRLHTREERDAEASIFCIVAIKPTDDDSIPPRRGPNRDPDHRST